MKCEGELINMTRAWDNEKFNLSLLTMTSIALILAVERPPGVQEVMGSIPVGDSEFFLVPSSCHVD